ncbi:MAG: NUDIX domain-containing protein [Chloroflexota bacterium]
MNYFEKLELINIDLNRQFPAGSNPFMIMTRLLEEAGELAEQVHIFEQSGAKPDKHGQPDPQKMAKEIQDVIGCAMQVALHYDLMNEVKEGIDFRFDMRLNENRFSAADLKLLEDWPPKNVICVGALVIQDDRVLLVRQAKGTSLAGQWSTPWGLVDAGEFPDHAAVRETLEEAGISVKIKGLIGIQNLTWQQAIGVTYLCEPLEGQPTPDGVETDAAGYFSLAKLDKLTEPIEPWTEWISRRVLTENYQLTPIESDNPFSPLGAFY